MNPRSLAALLAVLASIALPASASRSARAEEEGFTPLFNGKDLSGWRGVNGAPGTWSVRDGMIICAGKPICLLRSEKQYENFILELEWRHMFPGGNSGVFVWSDAITAKGQPFSRAIECQVLDGSESETHTSHGDVFSIHGARMKPDRPHPRGTERCLPSERRSRPSPEWNHYRITCVDGTLKLAVNGKEVSGGSEINPRKGYICLESEGSEVHFRNLRLRELPPSKTPLAPEQVAAVDEGFRALYSGADLKGWKVPAGAEGHWKANDWRLAFDGKGETIWTEEEFADFVLIADCRAVAKPEEGNPSSTGEFGLYLRGAKECRIQFPAAKDTGWRRATITVRGDKVKAELDGKVMTESAHCAAPRGPIGLGLAGGAVEFANIYVKELKG
jgi:hypothetical protein